MKDLLDFIRGVVRPIIAVGADAATIAMIFYGVTVPQEWWAMEALINGWWFYDRSRKRVEP